MRLPKMLHRSFDLQRIRILLGPRIAQLSNPSSPKKTVEAALGEGPDAHGLSALRPLRDLELYLLILLEGLPLALVSPGVHKDVGPDPRYGGKYESDAVQGRIREPGKEVLHNCVPVLGRW